MAFPEQSECDLLSRLLGMAGVSVPIPRFGSTDCTRRPSHLVAVHRVTLRTLSQRLLLG